MCSMDSDKSTLNRDSRVSPLDGYQPLLDIPCKVLVNSDSMKSSRMSTETPLVRMSQNTELLDLPSHLLVPSSLLISYCAHQRPSRLRCKHPSQENSQQAELLDTRGSKPTVVLTLVLSHFG